MDIVIDSNILFSALIKDALTRKLILEYENKFLFPEQIFIEFKKYKEELLIKSKMELKEFNDLLQLILEKVTIVPNETLENYLEESWKLIGEHSPEDIIFIACCLYYSNSILWSDDKKLKRQDKIKVLNTNEIIKVIAK